MDNYSPLVIHFHLKHTTSISYTDLNENKCRASRSFSASALHPGNQSNPENCYKHRSSKVVNSPAYQLTSRNGGICPKIGVDGDVFLMEGPRLACADEDIAVMP
ncbi:hypothetical protein TNCV_2501571 [Trichonephila clavipes]|nr:hypothetical protein TNCV_2501571 [Trichonephila clavipes]